MRSWHSFLPHRLASIIGETSLDGLLQVPPDDGQRPPPSLNQLVTTGALSAALLAYANADAWIVMRRRQPISTRINLYHLAMLLLTLLWAGAERVGPRELGVSRHGLGRSVGWGLVTGLLGAIPIRLFFTFPLVMNRAVTQPEFHGFGRGQLLALLAGQFLLSTAVFEEVAFRGVLHAKLVRLLGIKRALLVGSGLFAAWHAVITWHNLRRSNLPRILHPPLYGGAMGVLFLAGLLLGVLRQATGHVAGGVVAHWLMVATVVLAVARKGGDTA